MTLRQNSLHSYRMNDYKKNYTQNTQPTPRRTVTGTPFPQRERKRIIRYQLEDFATRKQTIPVKEPGEFRIASKYQRRSLKGEVVGS